MGSTSTPTSRPCRSARERPADRRRVRRRRHASDRDDWTGFTPVVREPVRGAAAPLADARDLFRDRVRAVVRPVRDLLQRAEHVVVRALRACVLDEGLPVRRVVDARQELLSLDEVRVRHALRLPDGGWRESSRRQATRVRENGAMRRWMLPVLLLLALLLGAPAAQAARRVRLPVQVEALRAAPDGTLWAVGTDPA